MAGAERVSGRVGVVRALVALFGLHAAERGGPLPG